jgi:hypothetical protein
LHILSLPILPSPCNGKTVQPPEWKRKEQAYKNIEYFQGDYKSQYQNDILTQSIRFSIYRLDAIAGSIPGTVYP